MAKVIVFARPSTLLEDSRLVRVLNGHAEFEVTARRVGDISVSLWMPVDHPDTPKRPAWIGLGYRRVAL